MLVNAKKYNIWNIFPASKLLYFYTQSILCFIISWHNIFSHNLNVTPSIILIKNNYMIIEQYIIDTWI
jgi:hypothetical protein